MADLVIQDVAEAGLDLSPASGAFVAAAAGGDAFANQGDVMLIVRNTDAATRTVTIVAQDVSEVVPGFGTMTKASGGGVVPITSGVMAFGPFPTGAFNDANGKVQVTYSAVVNLEVAAVRLSRAA